MATSFCSNCGTQVQENSAFCPSCGQKTGASAQQYQQPAQQQPAPQYQQPTQQPQYQPQYQQYGAYSQKNKKTGLIVGLTAGGVAVVALVIILIIVLGGGAGSALTDYDIDDVIGGYEGTVIMKSVDFSGDWKSVAEEEGFESAKEVQDYILDNIEDYLKEEIDCTMELYEEYAYIYADDNLFNGGDEIELNGKLKKGVLKGKEKSENGYAVSVLEYNFVLKEDKKKGYKLDGKIDWTESYESDDYTASMIVHYTFELFYAD